MERQSLREQSTKKTESRVRWDGSSDRTRAQQRRRRHAVLVCLEIISANNFTLPLNNVDKNIRKLKTVYSS